MREDHLLYDRYAVLEAGNFSEPVPASWQFANPGELTGSHLYRMLETGNLSDPGKPNLPSYS